MKNFLDTMQDIMNTGTVKTDRTGTGTTSKFGGMMRFDLRGNRWPIVTTREVDWLKIAQELEWMIKGIVDVDWLRERKNNIWNSWQGEESRTIGPMYGEQWRNWNAGVGSKLTTDDKALLLQKIRDWSPALHPEQGYMISPEGALTAFEKFLEEKTKLFQDGGRGGVDQLNYIINELKTNPSSRRMVVNVWHSSLLPDLNKSPKENADNGLMALAPCHSTWQVYTAEMTDLEILTYASGAYFHSTDEGRRAEMFAWGEKNGYLYSDEVGIARHNAKLMRDRAQETGLEDHIQAASDASQRILKAVYECEPTITQAGIDYVDTWKDMGKPTRKLSLLCFARSQDVPLGTVFNVGMYSLLAHLLAKQTNMVAWDYVHMMGDYHIYHNQHEGVNTQLERTPLRTAVLELPELATIEDFVAEDLKVHYESHEKIIYPRAAV